ncbi:MAG: NADH-quinone oxidoreductase subunit F [Candidatus Brockarchaeota archaeon]|nr:NADH-quinone oxidoreductase subunit F [Candidatus Brockarchaeota archaeon]
MSIVAYLRDESEGLPESLFHGRDIRVMVGSSTCSLAKAAAEVMRCVEEALLGFQPNALLVGVGCNGMCYAEVLVEIARKGGPYILYANVNPTNAPLVIDHFTTYVKDPIGASNKFFGKVELKKLSEEPFYSLQERRVLRYVGRIDPYSIDEYIAVGGYKGLKNALEMSPSQVIEEVSKSGLRGRGGAGFPTGRKWKFVRDSQGDQKYVICNADEGDPGAFMNRLAVEGNPFMIIEGMTIAAYAVGANMGYVFVRAEKPLMAERLGWAIRNARERGYLGENILDKGFSFDIEVTLSAGAFVCGEETAMLRAIEGGRAMPRHRPPFPSTEGLWGKPTLVNNVETFAHVPLILANGSQWYSTLGSGMSKGTKVFCLAGSVMKTGAVEVSLGTPIKRLVYDIGGGAPYGTRIKAIQVGGPSGGCIPAKYFDYGLDYESLTSLGMIMGSGGIVCLSDSDCMVDIAQYFLTFTTAESCGACVPCRVGLIHILNTLTDILNGKGNLKDIETIIDISNVIAKTSLCGLGKTAPNPILTAINYFREEFLEHILENKCRAKMYKTHGFNLNAIRRGKARLAFRIPRKR